MTDSTHVIESL